MKQFLFTTLIILITLPNVFGQWKESTFTPDNSLFEVEFPSPKAAYITGVMGILYKSTDAGISWNQIYDFGPFSSLTFPNFMNTDTGFVTANGGVYRTYDGGTSWTAISKNFTPQSGGIPIYKIKITGDKIYSSYISNDTSYFVRSDDFGTTWHTVFQNYKENAQPYIFSMVDSLNGYFVNPTELEKVFKTTNGGFTFTDTLLITNGEMVPQLKYDFKDLQNGYWYGTGGSRSYPTRTWNTGTFYFPIDLDGFAYYPF